jgi:putative spermidine/putrescine transport system substrate-binding protein
MSTSDSDEKTGIMNRRQFVRNAGLAGMGLASLGALAACGGGDDTTAGSAPAETGTDGGTGSAAAEAAIGNWEDYQGTLKVVGLGVDLIDPIKAAFEASHPGITLEFTVKSTPEVTQLVLTQPENYDIASIYFQQIDTVWDSGNLWPIPISEYVKYGEVSPLLTKGGLAEGNNPGQGDAPYRKLYVDESGAVVEGQETDRVTMILGNHNSDSFGYNYDELGEQDSWAILVDPELKGRVAIIDDAQIGLIDLAMAAEAAGQVTFVDKGNMTKEEIDELMSYLIELKKQGQFRGFWATFDESVNFMSSGEVVVESMWSPAVSLLQAQDFPVRYAAPKEGYRGWGGGNAIFVHNGEDPNKLAACLEYCNWWNTPEPAGIMALQGYYNAVISASAEGLGAGSPQDAFWLQGEPASEVLNDPFGNPSIEVGDVRDGGGYEDRNSNFNTWNSHMDEADYVNQKWQEFKSA